MRINDIETFRALMSGGTARKAASLLGVTQPAVSQSIKRLETEAGFLLFQRLHSRLVATPEAQVLLAETERMFVGISAIEHKLRSLRDFGVNQLDVACYPAFGLGFMPRALARLQQDNRAPSLPHVSLQVLSSQGVHARVAAGQSDFGLLADEVSPDGLDHSRFASFAGIVVMPPGHPLARFKLIKPQQLAEIPFLALNPEDASRRRLEAALAEHGVSLRIAAHTPYAASVCEMALRGLGVGLVNPITALDYAERGLTVRKLSIDVGFACMLVMRAGRLLSGTAQQLLSSMRKQLVDDERRLKVYLR